MRIPRHWARAEGTARTPDGDELPIALWRGSSESVEAARRKAREAIERLELRMRLGGPFPDRYAYGERPMREEILEVVAGTEAEPEAVVTRNAYGAEVLNCAGALFIDVDVEPARTLRVWCDRIKALLSGGRAVDREAEAVAESLGRARAAVAARPGWTLRAYRTRAGLRYLATHARFTPGSAESEAIMRELNADPRYVTLCRVQECFRARLTPKPWRVGAGRCEVSFPHADPTSEAVARQWQSEYAERCTGHATCAYLETIGDAPVEPSIARIVARHDARTRAAESLPLA